MSATRNSKESKCSVEGKRKRDHGWNAHRLVDLDRASKHVNYCGFHLGKRISQSMAPLSFLSPPLQKDVWRRRTMSGTASLCWEERGARGKERVRIKKKTTAYHLIAPSSKSSWCLQEKKEARQSEGTWLVTRRVMLACAYFLLSQPCLSRRHRAAAAFLKQV